MNNEILSLYEEIRKYKIDDWEEIFLARYVDLYDKYDYIIGDLSADILRLTGFYESNFKKHSKYHIKKRCAYDAPYFILKKKK